MITWTVLSVLLSGVLRSTTHGWPMRQPECMGRGAGGGDRGGVAGGEAGGGEDSGSGVCSSTEDEGARDEGLDTTGTATGEASNAGGGGVGGADGSTRVPDIHEAVLTTRSPARRRRRGVPELIFRCGCGGRFSGFETHESILRTHNINYRRKKAP